MLDIGFGNGYLLQKLAEKNNCTYYGIEISEDMIQNARRQNSVYVRDGRMHLSYGDILQQFDK